MRTDPSQTILLGDSFHSPEQAEMLPAYHLDHIMQIARQTELVWIEGNHDPSLPHRLPDRAAHISYAWQFAVMPPARLSGRAV